MNDRVKLLAYRIFDPTKAPLLGRKPLDLTPQIAARAYELYQERVHGESQQDQDWHEAEREIRRKSIGKSEGCVNVLITLKAIDGCGSESGSRLKDHGRAN